MIHKIFTIYDEKAKAYLPPFHLPESGQAIRSFKDCINSPDHQFGKNPEDYTLFTLGHFNDATASINEHAPKSLGNGVQFLSPHELQEFAPEASNEQKPKRNATPIQPSPRGGNST